MYTSKNIQKRIFGSVFILKENKKASREYIPLAL